ncbi:hypothetical protein QOZ80_6BG0504740 [Eleusine coracana subsp. coracana]|nr:hypothetical protein QOZ80_6BG0504740 [Eleusine coracana subsp. coracana]
MSPEKKRMVGLWEREVGRLAPKHFANAVMASQDFVHSLNIQKRLRKHRGCVNTLSFNADGSLLLSGSDDRSLALWNWEEALPTFTFHTGHSNNVLHAQFMHLSDDRSIVSCAADGEVRHSKIQQGGCVITDELVELEFAVHKLAVEPGSPHTFYCCCEDSSVWLFDLRGKDAVELFKCGAADHFSGENVELFAIAIDPRKPCFFAVAGSDEPASYWHPTAMTISTFSQQSMGYTSIMLRDKLPIPTAFKGHRNIHTIKGVNFLGPNCDYVTSGSDCGHIFIWRKKDGQLIRVMKGDKRIVNCVEQHPSGIVVASSGIENDIKIWEPGECENPSITHIEEVEAEMWHSSSSDSDAFFYYNDYDYMMDSDDDLYIETDDSVEDIDTSEDSSEEDENSDNSAKEDGDGDNSGG